MSSDIENSCSSDAVDGCFNKDLALKLRIGALVSILVAGAIGVGFPIIGKSYKALRPDKDIFFIIKAFAAGVLHATGFIHVLPDAFESLTSECLKENPWANFPFAGFVSMVAALFTFIIDYTATTFYERIASTSQEKHKYQHQEDPDNDVRAAAHSHAHSMYTHEELEAESTMLRQRVVSQVSILRLYLQSILSNVFN
ncbi:hypothetical protein SUGI_0315150 [Cryptomeria japonica]|nr:hypothetical protein SUGI_0315150 [Cryptomeria japonica]